MSIPEELRRKIERLAAAGASAGAGRTLRAFGGRTLLATLLAEIDETVLPEAFRVANAGGREILVVARDRRLMQVRAPEARQIVGKAGSVLWQPPDTPDAESIAFLRDLLEGFIADSDRLQVYPEDAPPPPAKADFGLSARRLAADWGLALTPAGGPPLVDVLDAILADNKAAVVAWMRKLDGQTECGGDGTLFEQVEALARTLERDVFAAGHAMPALARERCVFALDRFGKGGHGVVLAAFEGTVLTLLVRPAGLPVLMQDLQEALHGWHRRQASGGAATP